MDTAFDTMPPAILPDESEELRKQRLIASAGGMSAMPPAPITAPQPHPTPPSTSTMPPAPVTPTPRSAAFPATPASGSALVKSYAPGSPEYNAAVKETEGSTMPPAGVAPKPEAPVQPSMPPAGKAEMATPPAQPPVQGMPPAPVGPEMQRYQDLTKQGEPQLSGWKNILDKVASFLPFGKTVEREIGGTPQNYDKNLNQAAMRAAKEQTLDKGQQEAEAGAAQAQFNTPEKRRAYMEAHPDQFEEATDFQKNDFALTGKFPQKEPAEPKPEHADIVKEFSDALAKGDQARIEALTPRVKQFLDTTQKPPKEAAPNEKEKDISDYLEANKLQDTAANREKARGAIAQRSKPEVNGTDAKDIAEAIRRGDQPPTTTGLYRNASAVRAELARSGFNLAQAESDWHATQKHLATLNGAQQERLRQAVSFTNDSLSIIEDLYGQWQKVGPQSGWKAFNKGGLEVAKQLPGEAGNIAHRLEAQINDLTSELGTVYKGGNSSTDESLKLAAGNLKAEWNEKTFKDAIAQVRKNLEIRQNSIKHSQAAGVSANSPYNPEGEGGGSAFDKWKSDQKKP